LFFLIFISAFASDNMFGLICNQIVIVVIVFVRVV